MDDVLVNKLSTITRCLKRIREVYAEAGDNFSHDYTRQDSVILNLQRACEASIDIANYLNKNKQLAIPQSSRDSFQILTSAGLISSSVATNLKKMIGLGNIAVHDYKELNMDIVEAVINHHLVDFELFISEIKKEL
ncbi:hypothetical protein CMT41_10585 [Colwellia sp. MT41]|uniref:type VII toxin-antitoxin system HepT family RNase toxin n=1 Tax=Colwellia sp. MT41 TaxID=58049 RepID=UPI000717727A|nr:DUF86 domain-containing protein [Colwellia sp. MT41]ALO35114.1 hypothetical protein CMT41_10585 [Colwellia sp. MT41]